ncbi:hypothetical protein WN51_00407 [Melipona quadrifasciata]|uniref:Uncharacterized protein n=1 Tax=Melipona quadrifasciata TaxID=166423 RepID=A0A0N0U5J2_9HYME|nr:hypothetical protein WN51_00407 [Melipona quadrifasciata]
MGLQVSESAIPTRKNITGVLAHSTLKQRLVGELPTKRRRVSAEEDKASPGDPGIALEVRRGQKPKRPGKLPRRGSHQMASHPLDHLNDSKAWELQELNRGGRSSAVSSMVALDPSQLVLRTSVEEGMD